MIRLKAYSFDLERGLEKEKKEKRAHFMNR